MLPCAKTIISSISALVAKFRDYISSELTDAFSYGGGITTNEVSVIQKGKDVYHFVLIYLNNRSRPMSQGCVTD